jgi:hypothetical protein
LSGPDEEELTRRSRRCKHAKSDLEMKMYSEEFKTMRSELLRRSGRFKQARSDLEEKLQSEGFRKMRSEKLDQMNSCTAVKASTEVAVELEPVKVERISCDPFQPEELEDESWEDPEIKKDRLVLGDIWDEDLVWDQFRRKAMVTWVIICEKSDANPRLFKQLWDREVEGQYGANLWNSMNHPRNLS